MIDKLMTAETRAAEGIVRVLEEAGIDMVFGIAGGNMGRLYDALYDHQSSVRTVLVRHEQLASVMAEVYGRLTGKPGVAIGQGIFMLANGLMGTLEAHFGSSPMVLLTDFSDVSPYSKHAPYQSGTGDYGSADTRAALAGVTKQTFVAHEPAEAVQATQLAIKHALAGERGPVGVLYHSRVFKEPIDPAKRPFLYSTTAYLPKRAPADPGDIVAAAKALLAARQPGIIAGNGVRIAGAHAELEALAELLAAPVATTASGKGTFAETHRLALGVCGNFGQATANAVVGAADLLLAVGTRLGPADTAHENPQLIDPTRQTLLQIDVEPKNASWSFPCDVAVTGDAALALAQLAEAVKAAGAPEADVLAARRQTIAAAREARLLQGCQLCLGRGPGNAATAVRRDPEGDRVGCSVHLRRRREPALHDALLPDQGTGHAADAGHWRNGLCSSGGAGGQARLPAAAGDRCDRRRWLLDGHQRADDGARREDPDCHCRAQQQRPWLGQARPGQQADCQHVRRHGLRRHCACHGLPGHPGGARGGDRAGAARGPRPCRADGRRCRDFVQAIVPRRDEPAGGDLGRCLSAAGRRQ